MYKNVYYSIVIWKNRLQPKYPSLVLSNGLFIQWNTLQSFKRMGQILVHWNRKIFVVITLMNLTEFISFIILIWNVSSSRHSVLPKIPQGRGMFCVKSRRVGTRTVQNGKKNYFKNLHILYMPLQKDLGIIYTVVLIMAFFGRRSISGWVPREQILR